MKANYSNNYPYLCRGIVEDNIDPENLGRCKIRVPSVHGELTYPVEILPWARPLVLSPVKENRGSVNIPDKGDIVWVLFEGANRDFPIYLGGTYGANDLVVDKDIVCIYTEDGDSILYNRKNSTYTISTGSNKILLSPEGIYLTGDVHVEGNIVVTGSVQASEDVVGGNISLANHTHGGVESGTSHTSSPK